MPEPHGVACQSKVRQLDATCLLHLALPLDGVPGAVPVNASNPLVEVGIITADGKRQEGSSFPGNAVELLVVITR